MTRSPQKAWSRSRPNLAVDLADPDLEMYYNFDRDVPTFGDASNNRLTMSKADNYVLSRFEGTGLTARGIGAATGLGNTIIRPSTDSHTVRCWVTVNKNPTPASAHTYIGRGVDGQNWAAPPMGALYLDRTPRLRASIYTGSTYLFNISTIVPTKLVHAVYTIDHSLGEFKLYVDTNLVGTANFPSIISTASGGVFRIGDLNSIAPNLMPTEEYGETLAPAIYSGVKDQAWVSADYAEGAKGIQFQTDWGHKIDGTARGSADYVGRGPYRIPSGSTAQAETKTTTIGGKTVKAIDFSAAGEIIAPWSEFDVHGEVTGYGSWSAWLYIASGYTYYRWVLLNQQADLLGSGYRVEATGGNLRITQIGAAVVVTTTEFPTDQWFHCHVTRRYDGLWELFVDGASKGTGTNTGVRSGEYQGFDVSGAGSQISLSDALGQYSIRKYLGVVPPMLS